MPGHRDTGRRRPNGGGKPYNPGGGRPRKPRDFGNGSQLGRKGTANPYPSPATPTRGIRRPDENILQDVRARLAQHGQIDATQIEIEVQDGQVTLKGSVDTSAARRFAELAIEAIPGVIQVHDQMEVREN